MSTFTLDTERADADRRAEVDALHAAHDRLLAARRTVAAPDAERVPYLLVDAEAWPGRALATPDGQAPKRYVFHPPGSLTGGQRPAPGFYTDRDRFVSADEFEYLAGTLHLAGYLDELGDADGLVGEIAAALGAVRGAGATRQHAPAEATR